MGAEVRFKMHLPGYFSLRDLNGNQSNPSWPVLHCQDKTSEHYYHLFSARPNIDYDFDKQQLRQTILNHESIFQHQLHELHRLYKTQLDMMNEIQSTELYGRSSPFSSSFLSQNGRNGWQSGFSSIQNGLKFNNAESLESKCKKVQRRLFDLDLPADKYLDDDGDEVLEVSINGHHNSKVNPDITGNCSWQVGVLPGCYGSETCSPHLYSTGKGFTIDLNETVLDDESSVSGHHSLAKNSAWESCHNDSETLHKEPYANKKIFGVEISEVNSDSGKCLKILGVPVLEKHCEPQTVPSSISLSKFGSPVTVLPDTAKFGIIGFLKTDPSPNSITTIPEDNQSVNRFADRKLFIDLNRFVEEGDEKEEAGFVPSFPMQNSRRIEIDLEVPACVEMEASGSESLENNPSNKSLDRSQDSTEDDKDLTVVAAEALVSISVSGVFDPLISAMCQPLEDSPINGLQWLADVISSHEVESVSAWKDIIPDAMDYFEYVTLNLAETNLEEIPAKSRHSQIPEIHNVSRRLPRRGGRRLRKDFQRDVLPSLTSLSRNEVIHDLQTIEGLIKEAGGKWELRLTRKATCKTGSRRGRKRSCGGRESALDRTADAAYPHTMSVHYGCRETGREERNLVRWGKRTRRPPRQKCMVHNITQLIALK